MSILCSCTLPRHSSMRKTIILDFFIARVCAHARTHTYACIKNYNYDGRVLCDTKKTRKSIENRRHSMLTSEAVYILRTFEVFRNLP